MRTWSSILPLEISFKFNNLALKKKVQERVELWRDFHYKNRPFKEEYNEEVYVSSSYGSSFGFG